MALMSEVMERVSILFFHKSPPCSLPGVLSESSPRDLIERGVSGGAPLSRLPASSWITLRLDFLFMLSERSERVEGMLSKLVLVSMTAEFGLELLVPRPESVEGRRC